MFKDNIKNDQIKQYYFNIKNFEKFNNVIKKDKPDILFHLAAQLLVKKSYEDTIIRETNVIGTVNL